LERSDPEADRVNGSLSFLVVRFCLAFFDFSPYYSSSFAFPLLPFLFCLSTGGILDRFLSLRRTRAMPEDVDRPGGEKQDVFDEGQWIVAERIVQSIVKRLGFRFSLREHEKEEIAQETLLRLLLRNINIGAEEEVRALAWKIAEALVVDEFRKWTRNHGLFFARRLQRQAPPERPEAERRELRSILRKALKELPQRKRRTLILRFLGGKRSDVIARMLGMSRRTVQRDIKSGLAYLRSKLRDFEPP
jgi:RNA polymerase sigma factor (sigma-70 family)